MTFFSELKRRNVIRMAGLYLVGAWLIVQVAGTLLPVFEAPSWVMKTLVGLLAVGFVPALIFSWVFELTPQGIKRDAEVMPEESIAPQTARRMDRTIIAVLICALIYFGVDKFVLAPRHEAAMLADAKPSAPTAASKSIAVLPFTDLSPTHDQEYFSDGMAEELLNALAKVKDLKVAGRTSSFSFKGKNEDIRSIGKVLSVANILEGSVRKQGDKVRITAQLIQVSDGFHLWSDSYDGDLSDVFQLQERIARAITDQLKVVLEGDQKTQLVPVATTNSEAYTLYLQATDALNHRDYMRMGEAIGWLDQALKLDPSFARAHSRMAMIHVLGWAKYGASVAEGERQARLAIALDPTLAEPYYALQFVARKERHFLDARGATDRALTLEPDDASSNFYDAQLLINTGYTRRGIAQLDHALAIDPLLPNALHWRAEQYLFAGDTDTAERLWKRAGEAGLSYAGVGFSQVAKARGDYATARSLDLPRMLANPDYTICLKAPEVSLPIYLEGAFGGDAAAGAKAQAVIDECLTMVSSSDAGQRVRTPLWAALGLLYFGQNERVLQVILQRPTSDDAGLFLYLWNPQNSAARRLPEFTRFARKIGFADLWDKYGAPDLCKRNDAGEYVCE